MLWWSGLGPSSSSWMRLASTSWTGRLCCVRSFWTRCAFTRLTQHRVLSRTRKQFIDKVVEVLIQLTFQQSKVFVFVSPQIQFIDRSWTFQLRTERGTHSALCNGRRSCEQQRQVPAAHPCLVQAVEKTVESTRAALGKSCGHACCGATTGAGLSAETVEVPQISSSTASMMILSLVSDGFSP